jgi:hypothetical protein
MERLIIKKLQFNGDLGQRMAAAFEEVLAWLSIGLYNRERLF